MPHLLLLLFSNICNVVSYWTYSRWRYVRRFDPPTANPNSFVVFKYMPVFVSGVNLNVGLPADPFPPAIAPTFVILHNPASIVYLLDILPNFSYLN